MNLDRINEHYYGEPTDPATERARERIHWMCSQAVGNDVLDIGCSQGIACLILGREGFRCTGIDLEAASLTVAREALDKEDDIVRQRVTFRLADASQLPFEDGSVDTVLLGEVLEHLVHPARILSETRRVLREGGRLIVTVPYGLNAFRDHKNTYYPVSLLELVQPLFRTRTIETHGNYITYSGLKDPSYDPRALAAEDRLEQCLRLEKALEARCVEKERALLELGTKLYGQIRNLTAQGTVQADKIKELEEILKEKENQLRDLNAGLEQSRASLEALRREMKGTEKEHARLRTEAASSAAGMNALEQQLAALRSENAEMRKEFLTREAGRTHLEVELASSKSLVAQAEQALEKLQSQNREMQKELAAGRAERAHLDVEVASSTATQAAVRQQLVTLQTECAGLREALSEKDREWHKRLAECNAQFLERDEARDRQLREREALYAARLREREKHLQVLVSESEAEWKRKAANQRVREVVRAALPPSARVLVISKGDDDLLQLDGRYGGHFPQAAGGVYAGHHPADSAYAIAHLETLKAKGAEFLVVPASSFWWLDYYADFEQHLRTTYRMLVYQEGVCLIYALEPAPPDLPSRWELVARGNAVPAKGNLLEQKAAASENAKPEAIPPGKSSSRPSGVPLGVILDEFTMGCLRPECGLITFRPDNWKATLERHRPAALFVESAWRGNDGAWLYRVASYQRNMGNELAELLEWARREGLPSIFWNKEDPVHFDRFIERARLFSHVFTTDVDCVPRYRERVGHERVYALPFAAQPAIHNPIQAEQRMGAVCFAGTYYGDRHAQRQADMDHILRPAIPFGLEIYDRQHGMTGKGSEAYRFPDIYQACIKGRLEYDAMVKAYKRYRVFLNVNSVKQSPTMFSRRVFELLASGTPVISTYSRGIIELLGEDVVFITESEADTQRHLERLLGDEDAWARASVRGIRKVMREHTYRHRLQEVAGLAGIPAPEPSEPRISVVVRVTAGADLTCLAAQLASQTYRAFDVVLVSADPMPVRDLQALQNALPGLAVETVTGAGDVFARCMKASHAEYVAFLDMRDYYGPNYLMDHAVAATYSDTVFAGKHTVFQNGSPDGERGLKQPGHEFTHVTSVQSATLAAKKTALSKELFTRALNRRVFKTSDRPILSIDRFNYLQNAFDGPVPEGAVAEAAARRAEVHA